VSTNSTVPGRSWSALL